MIPKRSFLKYANLFIHYQIILNDGRCIMKILVTQKLIDIYWFIWLRKGKQVTTTDYYKLQNNNLRKYNGINKEYLTVESLF